MKSFKSIILWHDVEVEKPTDDSKGYLIICAEYNLELRIRVADYYPHLDCWVDHTNPFHYYKNVIFWAESDVI